MRIRLLGDVEIEHGRSRFAPTRSGERCVLASLALEPGRPVRIGTLVDNLWGDDPPTKAEETVATYIRSVRRLIERAGGERSWLASRRPGAYVLLIDAGEIDYHLYRSLNADALLSARGGDRVRALDEYDRALSLWHAEALANVDGDWAEQQRYRLRQEWLDTVCAAMDLRLSLGQYPAVAARAQQIAHDHPTERVVALALHGLSGSGQQSLIPAFMSRAAQRMWQVAGARPTADLVALARRLTADSAAGTKSTASTASTEPVPPKPAGPDRVVMIATNNRYVWQSAGDQFIIDR